MSVIANVLFLLFFIYFILFLFWLVTVFLKLFDRKPAAAVRLSGACLRCSSAISNPFSLCSRGMHIESHRTCTVKLSECRCFIRYINVIFFIFIFYFQHMQALIWFQSRMPFVHPPFFFFFFLTALQWVYLKTHNKKNNKKIRETNR